MRCHNSFHSCQPAGCQPQLGKQCGTSIHTEDVEFSAKESNLVYMDKVYSYNQAESCPIVAKIDTGASGCQYDIDFTTSGCGPFSLDPNATFCINSACAVLQHIGTIPDGGIDADQVSINGYTVDSLAYSGGQYTARINDILSLILRDRCQAEGLPTKTYFLVNNVGPLKYRAKFILQGTVASCGRMVPFEMVITNRDDAPDLALPCACPSSFVINDLAIPCGINGIAPEVRFQLGGTVELVNPKLYVTCGNGSCDCGYRPSMNVALSSGVVIKPAIHAEVTRKTLFCVDACQGLLPCTPNEQTCWNPGIEEWIDPLPPACSCGTGSSRIYTPENTGYNALGNCCGTAQSNSCGNWDPYSCSGCNWGTQNGCGCDQHPWGCNSCSGNRPHPPIPPMPPRPPRPQPRSGNWNGLSW
ncbi:MAG: hypothetical protein IJO79_02840 [Firmicutes bacterium]|nr:hypothetical protein [Bacillota bacterium]